MRSSPDSSMRASQYSDAFSSEFSAGGAPATEYAVVVPPSPLGVAGVEGAEWTRTTTDRYAREFMPTADSFAR